ncbi:MAG: DUF1679 domain-containing protein [Actinobacteria bacterium]|nr:DUF1679 domain-containing protein [Actinomycetota bacterium]
MTGVEIPSDVTEVSAAWLEAAMKAGGKIQTGPVRSIELVQIGEGIGVMGEIYRAKIDYSSGTGPASVVVKLPSRAEANREQGISLGMYEAEVNFYNRCADRTVAFVPKAYYADIESGTARFIIVMEDMGGLSMVSQIEGMSEAQALAAIDSLAAVHASWWGKADDPAIAWAPSTVHERIQVFAQMWPALWQMFQPNFGDMLSTEGLALGEWISTNYWQACQTFSQAPWTMLHLDYRVDNLMFDRDRVAVVDWQSLGRGPAAYDLAYLLGGSVTVEVRRKNEERWVTHYLEELHKGGVDYPAESFMRDYRRAHVIGGTSTAVLTGATFDLGNERGKQLIASMAERHFAAAVDLTGRDLFD